MTIKELRVQLGLSQREFAERFNIPLKTIRNWEQGVTKPVPYIPELIQRLIIAENRR